MRHTLYELDVRLREIEPAIWRTLEVPGACSLQQLHAASLADEVVEARSAVGPLVRRARKPTAPRGRQRTRS